MNTQFTPISVNLYYIPVETRVPLKFGSETLTNVICARACITITGDDGRKAQGWGETPLSVQWVWPSSLGYQERCDCLQQFTQILAEAWTQSGQQQHPIEAGYNFIDTRLPELLSQFNSRAGAQSEPMPLLAALVCCSVFDIALHDAYGCLLGRDVYTTYNSQFMSKDLAAYLTCAEGADVSFEGKYPEDFFADPPMRTMPAWHLVGGKDPLDESELTGDEPEDGYPVILSDWIRRDGLTCLKVKLRGNDSAWDYERLVKVGKIAIENDAIWLTSDFNCTVTDPAYVNDILDRMTIEHPRISQMILYVEQPFPYDLEENRIDVHSVSARKPLFMDESAHDWRLIRLGRELGWTGVALKTCKTQTGALLSMCWAKAHGMTLMVQDLTNPMLAQVPHLRLAAYAGTIMGVETNSMQFYPDASASEAIVHPGIYKRRKGQVDLSTITGAGFGYRIDEIKRKLPDFAAHYTK